MNIRIVIFLLAAMIMVQGFVGRKASAGNKKHRYAIQNRKSWFDTTDAMTELIRLQGNYSGVDHLSFDINFLMTTTVWPAIQINSFIAHYKANRDSFYVMYGDSGRFQIQDANYHMGVDTAQQEVTIDRPAYFFKVITQMDILDTIFQNQNLQSLSIKDTLAMRKITFQFYKESLYKGLDILYDTGTYRLRIMNSLVGFRSALPADSAATSLQTVAIKATFGNWQNNTFGDSIFNLNKYFTVNNGDFLLKSPYDSFAIINYTLN